MTDKKPEYLKISEEHIDITLNKPLMVSGTKVNVIRMREPTVGDQLAASESSGSESAKEISLIANLCGVAPIDIQSMSLRNYKRVQEALVNFIE